MKILDSTNSKEFLSRFYDCSDGIIRRIALSTSLADKALEAHVTMSVQDREAKEDDGWVNLCLLMKGVKSHSEGIDIVYNEVISDGIKIGFFADDIYLDLHPYTDEPESIEDFKKSQCLIIATGCSWSVGKYNAGT